MHANHTEPNKDRQKATSENEGISSASGTATQQKRRRKWAPRVRTGCITCRQRHIKCDEKKPACVNCACKGRTCAYEPWLVSRQPNQAIVPQPSPVKTPFQAIPEARERQLFFLFRQHFVVDVSVILPSEFWQRASLLACQEYPAAWHAALAIGAIYRSEERDVDGPDKAATALRRCEREEDEISALKHCNKAMRLLSELRHGETSLTFAQQEMVLVTCMLLNRYYRLRRQDAAALVHAKNGIKLLGEWGFWQRAAETSPTTCLPNCVAPLGWMFVPFMNLEMELFGAALRPSIEPSLAAAANRRISIGHGNTFASVQDAYEEILAIALSHRRRYESIAQSSASESHAWHRESNQFHFELFASWQRKFCALQLKLGISPDDEFGRQSTAEPQQIVGVLVAKIYAESLGNMLRLDTAAGSFVLEDFPDHFRAIVRLADEVFRVLPRTAARRPPGRSWMAAVPMVCASLQAVGLVCRDEAVRARALALLEAHPHRNECYDSALFVPVAREKAAVERAGWRTDPVAGGCACRAGTAPDVCEAHRVTQITPAAEQPRLEDGLVTLRIATGLDARRGEEGRCYTVPYATDRSVTEFRWGGFPWGKAASKEAEGSAAV